jgi:hypothetical protein
LRVTVTTASTDVQPMTTHHLLQGTEEEPWPVFATRVESMGPENWVVVVMEDLATGQWAADVVEIP